MEPCRPPGLRRPTSPPSRNLYAPPTLKACWAKGGAPADEYEPEEEAVLAALGHMPTAELLATNVLPKLEQVWRASFHLDDRELAERRPALLSLAKEIERFFGPESKPRTRAEILAENGPA